VASEILSGASFISGSSERSSANTFRNIPGYFQTAFASLLGSEPWYTFNARLTQQKKYSKVKLARAIKYLGRLGKFLIM
jgi:hypothetical protein